MFVNNGLLRDGEVQEVQETLTSSLGIQLTVVDASQRFLDALVGQIQPEMKRKIIGRIFIEVFQEAGKKLEEEAAGSSKAGDIEWLLQGTLYPDVVSNPGVKIPLSGLNYEFQGMSWLSRHIAKPAGYTRWNKQY